MPNPNPMRPPRVDDKTRQKVARNYASGKPIKWIAARFGISTSLVCRIAITEFGCERHRPTRNAVFVTARGGR